MKFSDIKIIKWLIGLPMKTKIISAVVAGTMVVGSGVGIGIAVYDHFDQKTHPAGIRLF